MKSFGMIIMPTKEKPIYTSVDEAVTALDTKSSIPFQSGSESGEVWTITKDGNSKPNGSLPYKLAHEDGRSYTFAVRPSSKNDSLNAIMKDPSPETIIQYSDTLHFNVTEPGIDHFFYIKNNKAFVHACCLSNDSSTGEKKYLVYRKSAEGSASDKYISWTTSQTTTEIDNALQSFANSKGNFPRNITKLSQEEFNKLIAANKQRLEEEAALKEAHEKQQKELEDLQNKATEASERYQTALEQLKESFNDWIKKEEDNSLTLSCGALTFTAKIPAMPLEAQLTSESVTEYEKQMTSLTNALQKAHTESLGQLLEHPSFSLSSGSGFSITTDKLTVTKKGSKTDFFVQTVKESDKKFTYYIRQADSPDTAFIKLHSEEVIAQEQLTEYLRTRKLPASSPITEETVPAQFSNQLFSVLNEEKYSLLLDRKTLAVLPPLADKALAQKIYDSQAIELEIKESSAISTDIQAFQESKSDTTEFFLKSGLRVHMAKTKDSDHIALSIYDNEHQEYKFIVNEITSDITYEQAIKETKQCQPITGIESSLFSSRLPDFIYYTKIISDSIGPHDNSRIMYSSTYKSGEHYKTYITKKTDATSVSDYYEIITSELPSESTIDQIFNTINDTTKDKTSEELIQDFREFLTDLEVSITTGSKSAGFNIHDPRRSFHLSSQSIPSYIKIQNEEQAQSWYNSLSPEEKFKLQLDSINLTQWQVSRGDNTLTLKNDSLKYEITIPQEPEEQDFLLCVINDLEEAHRHAEAKYRIEIENLKLDVSSKVTALLGYVNSFDREKLADAFTQLETLQKQQPNIAFVYPELNNNIDALTLSIRTLCSLVEQQSLKEPETEKVTDLIKTEQSNIQKILDNVISSQSTSVEFPGLSSLDIRSKEIPYEIKISNATHALRKFEAPEELEASEKFFQHPLSKFLYIDGLELARKMNIEFDREKIIQIVANLPATQQAEIASTDQCFMSPESKLSDFLNNHFKYPIHGYELEVSDEEDSQKIQIKFGETVLYELAYEQKKDSEIADFLNKLAYRCEQDKKELEKIDSDIAELLKELSTSSEETRAHYDKLYAQRQLLLQPNRFLNFQGCPTQYSAYLGSMTVYGKADRTATQCDNKVYIADCPSSSDSAASFRTLDLESGRTFDLDNYSLTEATDITPDIMKVAKITHDSKEYLVDTRKMSSLIMLPIINAQHAQSIFASLDKKTRKSIVVTCDFNAFTISAQEAPELTPSIQEYKDRYSHLTEESVSSIFGGSLVQKQLEILYNLQLESRTIDGEIAGGEKFRELAGISKNDKGLYSPLNAIIENTAALRKFERSVEARLALDSLVRLLPAAKHKKSSMPSKENISSQIKILDEKLDASASSHDSRETKLANISQKFFAHAASITSKHTVSTELVDCIKPVSDLFSYKKKSTIGGQSIENLIKKDAATLAKALVEKDGCKRKAALTQFCDEHFCKYTEEQLIESADFITRTLSGAGSTSGDDQQKMEQLKKLCFDLGVNFQEMQDIFNPLKILAQETKSSDAFEALKEQVSTRISDYFATKRLKLVGLLVAVSDKKPNLDASLQEFCKETYTPVPSDIDDKLSTMTSNIEKTLEEEKSLHNFLCAWRDNPEKIKSAFLSSDEEGLSEEGDTILSNAVSFIQNLRNESPPQKFTFLKLLVSEQAAHPDMRALLSKLHSQPQEFPRKITFPDSEEYKSEDHERILKFVESDPTAQAFLTKQILQNSAGLPQDIVCFCEENKLTEVEQKILRQISLHETSYGSITPDRDFEKNCQSIIRNLIKSGQFSSILGDIFTQEEDGQLSEMKKSIKHFMPRIPQNQEQRILKTLQSIHESEKLKESLNSLISQNEPFPCSLDDFFKDHRIVSTELKKNLTMISKTKSLRHFFAKKENIPINFSTFISKNIFLKAASQTFLEELNKSPGGLNSLHSFLASLPSSYTSLLSEKVLFGNTEDIKSYCQILEHMFFTDFASDEDKSVVESYLSQFTFEEDFSREVLFQSVVDARSTTYLEKFKDLLYLEKNRPKAKTLSQAVSRDSDKVPSPITQPAFTLLWGSLIASARSPQTDKLINSKQEAYEILSELFQKIPTTERNSRITAEDVLTVFCCLMTKELLDVNEIEKSYKKANVQSTQLSSTLIQTIAQDPYKHLNTKRLDVSSAQIRIKDKLQQPKKLSKKKEPAKARVVFGKNNQLDQVDFTLQASMPPILENPDTPAHPIDSVAKKEIKPTSALTTRLQHFIETIKETKNPLRLLNDLLHNGKRRDDKDKK